MIWLQSSLKFKLWNLTLQINFDLKPSTQLLKFSIDFLNRFMLHLWFSIMKYSTVWQEWIYYVLQCHFPNSFHVTWNHEEFVWISINLFELCHGLKNISTEKVADLMIPVTVMVLIFLFDNRDFNKKVVLYPINTVSFWKACSWLNQTDSTMTYHISMHTLLYHLCSHD